MSEFKFTLQDDESIQISPNAEDFSPYIFPVGCIKRDEANPRQLWFDSMSITINDHIGGELSRKCEALVQLLEDAPIMLLAIRMIMQANEQKEKQ